MSMYIDGVLQTTQLTIFTTRESFLFNVSNDYGFGSYDKISQFSNSVLSNFVIETNGSKVFEETFNNTTLGTITGTEQYAPLGGEVVSLQSFCGVPISNYSSVLGKPIT